ncbi:MAG TPA: LysM peptidoglycan-binding domain-containing protein [Mycobacteriales bacterium]|jgi:LysM repeat protein|nr:LysM peptidoglycan-binding domain-containing protein [Mycobacteriales bacterium]
MVLPRIALRSLTSNARTAASAVWRKRTIAIPVLLAAALTGSASGISLIRVHSGDTLSAIALRYHTTVAHLVALNHLPGDGDLIYAGQSLKVPGASAGHTVTHVGTIYHTVVPGDTLDGIAERFHVKPATIARRNHLPSSLIVVLGQRLAIRHRVVTHTAPSSGGATSAALQDRAYLSRRSEPSQDTTASLIRSTAAHWGLDPSLALAISWQESGWNMRAVSPVDALGAMQVMRYTGSYLSDDVVHRSLNLYDAQDNITAGVALLSVLTHEAVSTRQAIAGYYQGLQSVRDHGMYASTQQYVRDVMALRQRY